MQAEIRRAGHLLLNSEKDDVLALIHLKDGRYFTLVKFPAFNNPRYQVGFGYEVGDCKGNSQYKPITSKNIHQHEIEAEVENILANYGPLLEENLAFVSFDGKDIYRDPEYFGEVIPPYKVVHSLY